jgi:hypothetical protein
MMAAAEEQSFRKTDEPRPSKRVRVRDRSDLLRCEADLIGPLPPTPSRHPRKHLVPTLCLLLIGNGSSTSHSNSPNPLWLKGSLGSGR